MSSLNPSDPVSPTESCRRRPPLSERSAAAPPQPADSPPARSPPRTRLPLAQWSSWHSSRQAVAVSQTSSERSAGHHHCRRVHLRGQTPSRESPATVEERRYYMVSFKRMQSTISVVSSGRAEEGVATPNMKHERHSSRRWGYVCRFSGDTVVVIRIKKNTAWLK